MIMIMMVVRYETKRMLQYRIELLKVTVEPREICEYYSFESPAAWLAYHQSIFKSLQVVCHKYPRYTNWIELVLSCWVVSI